MFKPKARRKTKMAEINCFCYRLNRIGKPSQVLYMQLKTVLAIVSGLVAVGLWQPALAGDLEDGIKAYNAKEYATARQLLEKVIAAKPSSWQAHYYLGNTFVVLGQNSRAKYEYELCKHHCTNPAMLAHCKAAIDRMDKHIARSVKTEPAGEAKADATEKPKSDADKVAEDRKANIMKLAAEDCARIRKEAKEQMQNEATYSGRRWRNVETGERTFDISEDRKEEIERACEEHCRKVMDEAKRKCSSYH